jgi:transcriptional regulator with XRE-family HTH domain
VRRQKEELMPEIVRRDRQGETCRQIADALGIAKSTVARWLQGRQRAAVAASLGTAKGTARLAARYDALYRKALRGFNRSARDKEVRVDEKTKIRAGQWTDITKSVRRTETRVANAAFLARALEALKSAKLRILAQAKRRVWSTASVLVTARRAGVYNLSGCA